VCVPIDQSGFDHFPSKTWVIKVVKYLCSRFRPSSPEKNYYDRVSKAHLDGLRTCQIRYGDVKWSWEGGILSGWRWTALIDTIVNYVEYQGLKSLYKLSEAVPPCMQGDDTMVFAPSEETAAQWVSAYERHFPVNKKKFFVDRGRQEFLRKICYPNGVVGYPARAVASCVRHQAWQSGINTAAGFVKNAKTLIQRGFDEARVKSIYNTRIAEHLKAGVDDVTKFLHTPCSYGGAGWYPLVNSAWQMRSIDRVDDAFATDLNNYDEKLLWKSDWKMLTGKARRQVYRSLSWLDLPTRLASSALVSGLKMGLGNKKLERLTGKRPASHHLPFPVLSQTVRPPELLYDPSFCGELIRRCDDRVTTQKWWFPRMLKKMSKSLVIDLAMGKLRPSFGSLQIGAEHLMECSAEWANRIPTVSYLHSTTLRTIYRGLEISLSNSVGWCFD